MTTVPDAAGREAARCARLFWGWLTLRTLLWTALAALTQPNGPLDLIEWLSWGHEWRWGYHKHPPLPAWIAEAAAALSPGDVWGVYLASYLTTAAAVWAAWRLGREMLPPRLALLSALCLDGLIFCTYDPAEFSNNVVLNATWALTVLCLHRALRSGGVRWWLGLGLAVGAGLLTKYTLAVLLVPLGVAALADLDGRQSLRTPGPYLAAGVAALAFLPHLLWMIDSGFATVRYGLERAASEHRWHSRLSNPAFFVGAQLLRLLPVAFVLWPLTGTRGRLREAPPGQRADRAFLAWAVLGPPALLVALSLAGDMQLREVWGYPLWTFTGVLLLACLRRDGAEVARAGRRWAVVAVGFVVLAVVKNVWGPALLDRPGRVHFPGRRLVEGVSAAWGARGGGGPCPLVAGDAWLAGNVACYGRPRPSVYPTKGLGYPVLDPAVAPWTGDDDLQARGGVLLWDAGQLGDALPADWRRRFPAAEVCPPLVLPYDCQASVPPARVGVAVLRSGQLSAVSGRPDR
jgi:4-amino-4-deoxy-L-arabinose transferase-like glycosyltransferase